MTNTIRIPNYQFKCFQVEADKMGIQYINLGDVDGDTRIMLDTDDLLDVFTIGYLMGVNAITDALKSNIIKP